MFIRYVKENFREFLQSKSMVMVSPDVGGVKRCKSFADVLHCNLAIIHKERKQANMVDSMTLVGSVEGMTVLIIDDMVDTCGRERFLFSFLFFKF
jgi:ribose-phosphate pyrophosphokinase